MDKMDKKQDKAMIKKAIGQHDTQQHGGKKTALALKKGGAACYAKGGKTNSQMKTMGRNLAKVANQKVSSFTYKSSRGK
jgi:hypothetical protein